MAQAIAGPPSHYNNNNNGSHSAIHHDALPSPHGKKRAADTSLETEQRLSKRFEILHLDPPHHPIQTRLYTPVSPSSRTPPCPSNDSSSDNSMHIDDTPHKIYIHDLSAELSSIDSSTDPDHNPRIFIPDIERHLARIPKHILTHQSGDIAAPARVPVLEPTRDNQLILYNAPSVLSIPEEQERVRKAIAEARARMRGEAERRNADASSRGVVEAEAGFIHGGGSARRAVVEEVDEVEEEDEDDPDAMDLD